MNVNPEHTTSTTFHLELPDPAGVHPPEDVYDLFEEYIESTSTQLEELEQVALAYEQGSDPEEQEERAGTIRRVLHRIKGESGVVGFELVAQILHQAENVFEALSVEQRPDMLLRLGDWLTVILENMTLENH